MPSATSATSFAISRFSRTLSTLLSSGVPLLSSLTIVRNIIEMHLTTSDDLVVEMRGEGADCIFICHPGFTGVFSSFGFREVHLPDPGRIPATGDYWAEFIGRHLPDFDLSPEDQLTTYVAATWEAIVDTVEDAEEALSETLRLLSPDLIVLDNVVMFPAIALWLPNLIFAPR